MKSNIYQRAFCQIKVTSIILLLSLMPVHVYAECVLLLHGLARSSHSMVNIEKALVGYGYTVVNISYPSRRNTIDVLANEAIPIALKQCGNDDIHIVTHSMGAILFRQYVSEHHIEKLSRVVMLGPPNQGSEVVDALGSIPGFHFINGDAGLQLGTDKNSLPNSLGAADYDLGIVAGNRSVNGILSLIIPGPDDGKVSIERTKLTGMNDHIVMPVTHTFMMKNEQVIHQIIFYLKNGMFDR